MGKSGYISWKDSNSFCCKFCLGASLTLAHMEARGPKKPIGYDKHKVLVNPHGPSAPFLYPLKTSENLSFQKAENG